MEDPETVLDKVLANVQETALATVKRETVPGTVLETVISTRTRGKDKTKTRSF